MILNQFLLSQADDNLLPITHLNTPCIFESHSGLMGFVIRIPEIHKEQSLMQENFFSDSNYRIFIIKNSEYLYLTVVLARNVLMSSEINAAKNLIDAKSDKSSFQVQINIINNIITRLMSQLSSYKPYLLGWQDEVFEYSELARFFGLINNSNSSLPLIHIGQYIKAS